MRWELSIPGVGSRTYTNVSSVTAKPTEKGKMIVKVINTSGCPDDNYSSVSLNIDKRDVIIIPTNPIYSGTSIQAKVYSLIPDEQNTMSTMSASSNTENSIRIPYDGDFVVEIWSDAYGRVASYDGFGADISIPSTGLTKGIYYIKLIIDGVQADVASIVVN